MHPTASQRHDRRQSAEGENGEIHVQAQQEDLTDRMPSKIQPFLVAPSTTSTATNSAIYGGVYEDQKSSAASMHRSPDDQALQRIKASLWSFLKYLVFLLISIHGISVALNTFQYREVFFSNTVNTLCSGYRPMDGSDQSALTESINGMPIESFTHAQMHASCNALPPARRFKKFIWFLTDGLPVKYSKKIFQHYSEHMVMHPIDLPGPKYSHAIYTSYLTGQLPTNYQGKPIKGDHLVKSMKRSPDIGPLSYIGPKWSFLAISGAEAEYKQFFDHIDIQEEPLDQPHDRAYRFFFKDAASRKKLKQSLESIKAEGGSLLTHSAIFDHINHGIFRAEPVNTRFLDTLAKRIADDMNTIKEWIDQNPDYLLILSSDHGTDDVSKGYVLHGYSTNGNEGYVMLYNPALEKHQSRIDVVDVAPTIATYLHKVDIPSDNIGLSHAIFPEVDSNGQASNDQQIKSMGHRANVLRQNIAQLCDTVRRRGIPGTCNLQHVNNILQLELDQSDATKAKEQLKEIETFANKLKFKLYNMVNKPWFWVMFYMSLAAVVIIYIAVMYLRPFVEDLTWSSFSNTWHRPLFLVPLYFGVFINLLLCWDTWKNVFRSGHPFMVWHASLAASLLYFFIAFLMVKFFGSKLSRSSETLELIDTGIEKNGKIKDDEGGGLLPMTRYRDAVPESPQMRNSFDLAWLLDPVTRNGIHRIFYSILIDWLYYVLHTLFSKQWKYVARFPRMWIAPYVLLVIFVMEALDVRWFKVVTAPLRLMASIARWALRRTPRGTSSESKSVESGPRYSNLGHVLYCCTMLALLFLYEATSANRSDSQALKNLLQKYYFVFNFHVLYFAFMAMAVAYVMYCLLLGRARNAENRRSSSIKIVIPVTIYAFGLMRDTPHSRILTLAFNFQYLHLIGPFLASLCELTATAFSRISSKSSNNHNKQNLYLSLLQQASVLYIINHFFYWFVTAREEKFNIDAHPFAGAVGMLSHQAHPSFNAFQMAFEKWHCMLLFSVYVHCALVGSFSGGSSSSMADAHNPASTLKMMHASPSSDMSMSEQVARGYQHISHMFTSIMTLMLFNAHWFLQLLLCFISMNHGFQESVIYLTVIGALSGLLQLMHVCDWWKQSNLIRGLFSRVRSQEGKPSQKSK